ncbi:MAG: hypothetical protein LLG01_16000 [Planctomycetaceae bacterium]|nr:hypothetical protein [Planctomycetaceae bacterium]
MTADRNNLVDHIEIVGRFLRSVNLEKDSANDNSNGYIVTPTARQVLQQLTEGLEKRSPHRSWTITGPYGAGKSAFGVFASRLFCDYSHSARSALHKLEEVDPLRARRLSSFRACRNGDKLLFPVLLTARRAPACVCLLEAVLAACSRLGKRGTDQITTKASALIKAAQKGLSVDSRQVVACIADLSALVSRRGHKGVLLVIDELGKLFEFAAHAPQKGDVFVLQELAEYASRSGDTPLLVLGILHQSFEEYGRYLDSVSRTEWSKIQGRFQDVAFLEPPEQVLRMIAAAIKWKSGDIPPHIRSAATRQAEHAVAAGICPPSMRRSEFLDICIRAYPFHPSTLVALPHLFHRFAQNERSLFSYLGSHEPKGFQDFLRAHGRGQKEPSFLRLPNLFDYFTANFGAGLFRQPHAKRWLEAEDVLERVDGLTDLDTSLVKAIGVLGALGTFSHLGATKAAIVASIAENGSPEVENRLHALSQKSVITFRKFNETYRIWEGSDVDVEERIGEGHRKTRATLQLADAIQRYLPARPIVARRHSFETGILRYFEVRYIDEPGNLQQQAARSTDSSGLILVCMSPSGKHFDEFQEYAAKGDGAKMDVLFALPQKIGEIRSTLGELAALQWAWDNTPELRDDRVARRELAMRITDTRQLLMKGLGRLLDPRDEPEGCLCLWYYRGKKHAVRRTTDVTQLLSDVCEQLYPKSPRIRNELIARRVLSSAAAAARRNLIDLMFSSAGLELLGLQGYPPERSMYESVLKATGLHRRGADGAWRFCSPSAKDPGNLKPTWERLSEIVFGAQPCPTSVREVFQAIALPPFGLPDGLHPVLLSAFMAVHENEVTLYREGTFVPEPSINDFEVLMKRPELYAIGGCRITGARSAVVERIANALGTPPATVAVVRGLFRMVKSFPEFATSTMSLSPATLSLRTAFANAKSPEKFLFVEVPESLDLAAFGVEKPRQGQTEAFFDALNCSLQEWSRCTHVMIDKARDTLLETCGLPAGMSSWPRLRELAGSMEAGLTNPVLLPFVRRIVQATADQTGVESVLAFVANRPPQMWTDSDAERFPSSARVLGDLLLETVSAVRPTAAHPMDALAPAHRKQAQELVHRLRSVLESNSDVSGDAVKAALAVLLNEKKRGRW